MRIVNCKTFSVTSSNSSTNDMPSENSDLSPVQQLLRLKRHETPGEDFVEDFLKTFNERQRSELLKQSARGLLWERLTTYWDHRLSSKWALAGAAAVLVLGLAWTQLPVELPQSGLVAEEVPLNPGETVGGSLNDFPVDMVMIMGRDAEAPVEEEPLLLSRHFSGGYADDARQVKSITKSQVSANTELLMKDAP